MSRPRYQISPSRETASDIGRIMRRAQELDKPQAPARLRRSKIPWLVAAFLLLSTAAAFNVRSALHPSIPQADPGGREKDTRFEIYVAVQHVNKFRTRHGRLPTNLEARGMMDSGLTYSHDETSYTLMGFLGESTVSYTDGESLEPFAKAAQELFGGRKP